jgi:hypothetical protein
MVIRPACLGVKPPFVGPNRTLPDCRLEVSMLPGGHATGHVDTGFLIFPLPVEKTSTIVL